MALRILHFTPDASTSTPAGQHLHALLEEQSRRADIHLVTLRLPESGPTPYPIVSIHDDGRLSFGKRVGQALALRRRYLMQLYAVKPDIVHIHGSWSYCSSRIALWSRSRGFHVVLSPNDSLEVAEEASDYGMKMWQMLSYQKEMLRKASAIHVTDSSTYQRLQSGHYNPHTVLFEQEDVENPSYYSDLCDDILALYRKVLDSDASRRMEVSSYEALSALLHVGTARDMQPQLLTPESILNLRGITPAAWRYILLYAHDHGIEEEVQRGINRMQLRLPELDVSQTPRFAPSMERDTQPLPSDILLSGDRKLRKSMRNVFSRDEVTEYRITTQLLNLRHLYRQKKLSLRHLCDLCDLLRHEDYDEDRLAECLSVFKLVPFARRVCQLLWESTYLEEGFMPVHRLDDSHTEEMRKLLITY